MDWQAQYESGETPWDEGAPHPALLDFIAESERSRSIGTFQGRILVPGSGLGNDVRAISTADNQVIGLDIAPGAVSRAQLFPKSGREEYIVADLFNLPPALRSSFDWIVEHTCFCAIDPSMRPAYAAAVAGALKPGGHLFAIFYLDPALDRQPPYGVAVPELDRFFSPAFALVREWVPPRTFAGRESRELIRLAAKGQEIQSPADAFKDPVVIEFLGLPESPRLVESDLEQALIKNLQLFLLELGKGFAFVSRQERITLDGDHFYIDLVFYHTVLKCYVLIDLKVGKLSHGDLGQLQLYVNYFDRERCTPGDNPTLGLILCTDKNDAVVKYTLGPEQEKKIFTSRYKLHLPSETELKAEIRRELKQLRNP